MLLQITVADPIEVDHILRTFDDAVAESADAREAAAQLLDADARADGEEETRGQD